MDENKKYDVKIIMIGEQRVGKTSLINAFLDKNFNPDEKSTSQQNTSSKIVEINNINLNVSIWDTMGQEKYRSITKSYIKGSDIVIFVYDITKRETFLELNFWINAVNEELASEEVIFGVAANKIDLFNQSEIETTEAEIFAEEYICIDIVRLNCIHIIAFQHYIGARGCPWRRKNFHALLALGVLVVGGKKHAPALHTAHLTRL